MARGNIENKGSAPLEKELEVTEETPKPDSIAPDIVPVLPTVEKNSPWVNQTEKATNYIKTEILSTEETLKKLENGVEENSDIHRQARELAYSKWEEREKNGQPGDEKVDFTSAIQEIKEAYELKQAFLLEREKRLEVLSSVELGSKDEELNKLAFEKADALRKKGEKVDDIECNDVARQELLDELGKELDIKELEKQIKEQREKKGEGAKLEKAPIEEAIPETEEPVPAPEKDAETIIKYKKELVDSFTNLLGSNPLSFTTEDKNHLEHNAAYSSMQKAAFKLTGESLDAQVKLSARAEVDRINAEIEKENTDRANEPGYKKRNEIKIISKKELYSPENRSKLELAEGQRIVGAGIRASWEKLTDKEKGKFLEGPKEYAKHLETERTRLSENGIDIPKDTYFYLLSLGFEPQKSKKRFFSKKISMAYNFVDNKGNKGVGLWTSSPSDFKERLESFRAEFIETIKNNVDKKLEDTYTKGSNNWMTRKLSAMGRVVKSIVNKEKFDIGPINEGERNTDSFEKTIKTSKIEGELNLLSDEQLNSKAEELNGKLKEKIGKFEKIIDEEAGPICSMLGLSKEKIEDFKKAAKKGGDMPGLDQKLDNILQNLSKNLRIINEKHLASIEPVNKLREQRNQEKIRLAEIESAKRLEGVINDLNEKLAAISGRIV